MIEPTALAEATVDLDAYRGNLHAIAGRIAPAELMAVVKGDAYGHGLLPIVATAIEEGVTRFGVLESAPGLLLRAAGIGREISLFAWLLGPDEDYRALIDAGIELGISRVEQLHAIETCGAAEPALLHLKIDTGLHRNGATVEEWPQLVRTALALQEAGLAEVKGVWTHIAEASDEDDTEAVRRFEEAIRLAEDLGARFTVRHLAASAAGYAREDCRYDMVRVGAFTYGIAPGDGIGPAQLGLTPVMTLTAPVISIGTRVEGLVAVLPLGWGHGLPGRAAGALPVTIDGRRFPILDVQQNHTVIDLGADGQRALGERVQVGDTAVIYGRPDRGELTLQDWADALGTIGEELIVRVSPSVPRRIVGETTNGTA
jgi:alanine racemase